MHGKGIQYYNTRRANIADYEVSPAGVALLKKFEGLKTNPYVCPGGTLTVGYGQCISQKNRPAIF
jgi:GH24 family phage-related lysozyme (muramidase)